MTNLIVQIDSVWKARNASEGRNVTRATCDGIEEAGDHKIIEAIARKLAERHPPETPVEVWRGDMPVFRPISLGIWAAGRVGKGEQPVALKTAQKSRRKAAE